MDNMVETKNRNNMLNLTPKGTAFCVILLLDKNDTPPVSLGGTDVAFESDSWYWLSGGAQNLRKKGNVVAATYRHSANVYPKNKIKNL